MTPEHNEYMALSHGGVLCRSCGCMVGDQEQHNIWHQVQDALLADIQKDARRGASAASMWEPLGKKD